MTIQLLFLMFYVYQNRRIETLSLIFIIHEYLLKHAILNLKLSAIMKTLISDYISQMQFKIDLKCILFNYTIKTENTIKFLQIQSFSNILTFHVVLTSLNITKIFFNIYANSQ